MHLYIKVHPKCKQDVQPAYTAMLVKSFASEGKISILLVYGLLFTEEPLKNFQRTHGDSVKIVNHT